MPRYCVFISRRSGEALDESMALKAALQRRGVSTLLRTNEQEGGLGDTGVPEAVIEAIAECEMVVIMGTRKYGEKTGSKFSSRGELELIMDENKPLFVVKMCDRFEHAKTRFLLPPIIAHHPWQPQGAERTQPPAELVDAIIAKLVGAIVVNLNDADSKPAHPGDMPTQLAQLDDTQHGDLVNTLYHRVAAIDKERAHKITAMLLESEPELVTSLLDNDAILHEQVVLAQEVLSGNAKVPNRPQVNPGTSLYVGDLSPQVNETELFNLFSSIGSVMSVRVCRDQITHGSLGYGYVNFNKAEDAEAAMGQLNFHDLHGRHIRIMKVERDPKKRRSGVGNIFISGLPADTTSVHLRDTFEQFGKILSCKAVLDHSGRCRGFGFVHFEDPKVAERAIAEANGKDAGGDRKLRVAPFKPRKQREQEQEERTKNFTNVYVKSLRRDADEEELGKLFEPYGDITSKALRTYKLKDTERPYGFVNFADTEAAQKCVEEGEMHQRDIFYVDGMAFEEGKKVEDFVKTVEECAGSEVERHHLQVADGKLSGFILFKEHGEETVDKAMTGLPEKMEAATDHISKAKLYVQRAQKKQERIRRLRRRLQERRRELRQRGGNLFVKNFNENVTEEDLRKFFEECGHVMSVKVMRDKEGVSRCFGFVTFATREEAESAIAKKNRQPLQDRPIYVAFHLTRQERQARKQQQHPQHPQQGMYMYPQYPGMPMGAFGPGYYNPQMMMVNPQMPRAMNFPAQAGNRGGPVGGPNRYMQQQNRPMPPQAQQQMARNPQQFRQQFAGQQQMPPQQQMQQMQQEAPQGQQQQMQLPQDVTSQLAHMDEEQRRRYLGDMLYHRVANIDKERAPKITGMLLAYDAGHLMNLLASDAALREQVMLAQNILAGNAAAPANQQQQGNQQQQQPAQQANQQAAQAAQ